MLRFFGFVVLLAGALTGIAYLSGSWPFATAATTADATANPQATGARNRVDSPLYGSQQSTSARKPAAIPSSSAYADPIAVHNASITIIQDQEVSSRVDGQIQSILVQLGQPVRAGEVICRLDDYLARTKEGYQRQKAESKQGIAIADAKVRAAAEIMKSDQAAGRAVSENDKLIHRYQHETAVEELKKAFEDQELARREWQMAVKDLEFHGIRAEIDGQVVKINKKVGESVKAGEPIFRISNPNRLRAEGTVDAPQALQLRPGMRALVEPETRAAPMMELRGHTAPVTGLALTPDSMLLASASEDHVVLVWDWQSGRPRVALQDPERPSEAFAIAASPVVLGASGKPERVYQFLVGYGDGRARIYQVAAVPRGAAAEKGVLDLKEGHRGAIRTVAFSPKGEYCATAGDDRQIAIWNAKDGKLLYHVRAEDDPRATAHRGTVTTVHFTADGGLVSAATDKTIKRWKLGTKAAELVSTKSGRTGDVPRLGVSANGEEVLFDFGDELRILDLNNNWNLLGSLQSRSGHGHFTSLALFSPTGKGILTAAAGGRLQLWAAPAPPEAWAFFRQAYEAGFHRNTPFALGSLTASLVPGNPAALVPWAASAAPQPTFEIGMPDTAGLTVVPQLWRLHSFEVGYFMAPEGARTTCGVFSPDERFAFTGGEDKVVRIWNLKPVADRVQALEAVLTFIGNQAVSGTGQVQVRAELDNLRQEPGRLIAGGKASLTLYPETAPRK